MAITVNAYNNTQVKAQDAFGTSARSLAADNRDSGNATVENQPQGDSVSISSQAKELAEQTSTGHGSKAEATAAVLQEFAAELEASRLNPVEILLGVMQKHLEESLESAQKQSERFKEESARLEEKAHEQNDAAPSSDIEEGEGNQTGTTGYNSAAKGSASTQSNVSISLKA